MCEWSLWLRLRSTSLEKSQTDNESHTWLVRVDSRDLQTSNISIWRSYCLGEVAFLKNWNQYWLPSDTVHQRFLLSPLPIFKLSLQVPWIDSSHFHKNKILVCPKQNRFDYHPFTSLSWTNSSKHPVHTIPTIHIPPNIIQKWTKYTAFGEIITQST